jgi:hypothetical protein
MLKLSLQIFYRRYHELVDRYEISIPQMAIDLFPLPTRHIPDLTIRVTCLKRNRNYLSFTSTRVHILHEHSSSHPSRTLEFTSFTNTRVHILHEHSSSHPSRALESTSFTSTRVHILHEHSSPHPSRALEFTPRFFVVVFLCLFVYLLFFFWQVRVVHLSSFSVL